MLRMSPSNGSRPSYCSQFSEASYNSGCTGEAPPTLVCQETCNQFASSEEDIVDKHRLLPVHQPAQPFPAKRPNRHTLQRLLTPALTTALLPLPTLPRVSAVSRTRAAVVSVSPLTRCVPSVTLPVVSLPLLAVTNPVPTFRRAPIGDTLWLLLSAQPPPLLPNLPNPGAQSTAAAGSATGSAAANSATVTNGAATRLPVPTVPLAPRPLELPLALLRTALLPARTALPLLLLD